MLTIRNYLRENRIERGDIYLVNLQGSVGCEQGGTRPVLVVQNDVGNKFSPTLIVASITSKITKAKLPTHVEIPQGFAGFEKTSVVLLEQLRTIDKNRLANCWGPFGHLDESTMNKVDAALLVSLGLKQVVTA